LNNYYGNYNTRNDERFIWPILPFVGGALIGYTIARPNNTFYPVPYYTYYNPYPVYNSQPIYR